MGRLTPWLEGARSDVREASGRAGGGGAGGREGGREKGRDVWERMNDRSPKKGKV